MNAQRARLVVIDIADVAAGRCCCGACARLDRRYPAEGWQLALPLGSGDRPDAIPLPVSDPDAPTAATVDVSAPFSRTVETRSRPIAGASS